MNSFSYFHYLDDGDNSVGRPGVDGPVKGVLVYHRVNRKKKRVRWIEDDKIQSVHYFEYDETERVNVNRFKHVGDMKLMDKLIEKEAFMRSRRLGNVHRILGGQIGDYWTCSKIL